MPLGLLTLIGSIAVLLGLPLSSLGSGNSLSVSSATRSVLAAVPKATQAVSNTVQSAVTPTIQRALSPVTPTTPVPNSSGPSPSASASAPAAAPRASGTAAAPRASGGSSTPAMYGTNPHGQGTVSSTALPPSTNLPYPYLPGGSGGEISVIGRGRSEQNTDGTYHAHTTILALFGTEILGVDAPQGQSSSGPLNAVQTGVLDKLCTGSGMFACLSVLTADTSATSSGANTNFSVASAQIGGAHGVKVGAAQSGSSIATSGSCQTAAGNATAADVNIAGGPVASLAKSTETTTACSGKAPTEQATSSVIGLGGTGLPLPSAGCANGTPNTVLSVAGLLETICNAYNTTEVVAPSGVREALTAIVLPALGMALAKTVVAASEAHSVAPTPAVCANGATNPPTCTPKVCANGATNPPTCTPKCPDSDHDCGVGPPGTGKCATDKIDNDGDCVLPGGGTETGKKQKPGGGRVGGKKTHRCTDSDHDCGNGPPGTGKCTNDTSDRDGDCVLPGGGSETGGPSGSHAEEVGLSAAKATTAAASSGSLPFTGQDVLKVLLIGLLLAGGGLALGVPVTRGRRR
ncbi:MAG: hypothetical protein ACYC91_04545 [Solirubrobacteraceae bacterium]